MTGEPTFTKSEIEGWLATLGKKLDANKDFADPFKFGYGQGLVAVMAAMDNEIRRRKQEAKDLT